jgi:flagellar assembly protein FliH
LSKVIKAGHCSFRQLHDLNQRYGGRQPAVCEDGLFSALSQLIETPAEHDKSRTPKGVNGWTQKEGEIDTDYADAAETIRRRAEADAETIRREARDFLDATRQKAQEIESDAYNMGFAQGKKDGEELGRRQYEAKGQRLEKVVQVLQEKGKELLRVYEAQMVRLCLEVGKCVVHQEIQTRPEIILDCIRAAMGQVMEGSRLNIHLNPKDADLVGEMIETDIQITGNHYVDIIPDNKIDYGGCLIETEFGLVDATAKTKWQAVSDAVGQILSKRAGRAVGNGA